MARFQFQKCRHHQKRMYNVLWWSNIELENKNKKTFITTTVTNFFTHVYGMQIMPIINNQKILFKRLTDAMWSKYGCTITNMFRERRLLKGQRSFFTV